MTVKELTDVQLADAIIRSQQYILNVPQVQQELSLLLQERESRSKPEEKKK
jgi:hypothetical protein